MVANSSDPAMDVSQVMGISSARVLVTARKRQATDASKTLFIIFFFLQRFLSVFKICVCVCELMKATMHTRVTCCEVKRKKKLLKKNIGKIIIKIYHASPFNFRLLLIHTSYLGGMMLLLLPGVDEKSVTILTDSL